ncbi:MAG: DUF1778 domain-containing protein [Aestuariivirga sp.]
MPFASALSLRISPRDRKLIDRAAQALNKSRTEFMLDSARAAATDALLDQRLFVLDETEMQAFEEALAKAPKVDTLIENLKSRPSPWAK